MKIEQDRVTRQLRLIFSCRSHLLLEAFLILARICALPDRDAAHAKMNQQQKPQGWDTMIDQFSLLEKAREMECSVNFSQHCDAGATAKQNENHRITLISQRRETSQNLTGLS